MQSNILPRQPPPYRCPVPTATWAGPPAGLDTLYRVCHDIYNNQPNPLQVTAVVKYWLGGPDPLDYISMYENPGDSQQNIPPHWHYISFGLSDLHGDGRVHEISGSDTPSGYGFELTFRLLRDPSIDSLPPTWPAAIMQALAKYVFQSHTPFCAGDHVSWHTPLDNSVSILRHMLMMEDPQLKTVMTPYGPVNFVQIIGICNEELQASQEWNGPGMIDLMKTVEGLGGPWLVTDMKRDLTMFQLNPSMQASVDEGIERDGSHLSGVGAHICLWQEIKGNSRLNDDEETHLGHEFARSMQISDQETEAIKATLKKGLEQDSTSPQPCGSNNISDPPGPETSKNEMCEGNTKNEVPPQTPSELVQVKFLDRVHVYLDLEAGKILPLALRGRLKHGHHFTFKSVIGGVAITILPPTVSGAFVTLEHPYAARGPLLQVLLKDEDVNIMLEDLTEVSQLDAISLPKTFKLCNETLIITLILEV